MKNININLSSSSYNIYIDNNILDRAASYINEIYNKRDIFIVTDDIVEGLYLSRLTKALAKEYNVKHVIIPHGEASKTIDGYTKACSELIALDIRRGDLLIALGGGVVGDLCGFIAATLFRGLDYVGIPTSLLSQMDSSIGGKTGIDFYGRKNILGAFKQPRLVLIDPLALNTLSKEEFNNGMGELIKHAFIGNKNLIDLLKGKEEINENVIYESLMVKANIVMKDEFDLNERMLLNFGHTFGHSLELEKHLRHGEAVALGMIMALRMGIDLGITNSECLDTLIEILKLYDLPHDEYNYKDYLKKAIYDKKNIAGTISFILIKDIGNPLIYKVSEDDL